MSRRASRPSGSRVRRSGAPAGKSDPMQPLLALLSRRGTDRAEDALDRWVDAVADNPDVFAASGDYLAKAHPDGFTPDERWLLLSIVADLEAQLDLEAREWPEDGPESPTDEQLRAASPVYRALSDAWSAMRTAIEVSFLRDIGMPEMARAMIDDAGRWERALRDGEATLLGVPRIVLTADDDPFGILLP
jgi:hypothetical protein